MGGTYAAPSASAGGIPAHEPHTFTSSSKMAALTTSSVAAVRAVRGAKANFAGSKAAFAAPARATVSGSRASLQVAAAGRELWCVSPRARNPGTAAPRIAKRHRGASRSNPGDARRAVASRSRSSARLRCPSVRPFHAIRTRSPSRAPRPSPSTARRRLPPRSSRARLDPANPPSRPPRPRRLGPSLTVRIPRRVLLSPRPLPSPPPAREMKSASRLAGSRIPPSRPRTSTAPSPATSASTPSASARTPPGLSTTRRPRR